MLAPIAFADHIHRMRVDLKLFQDQYSIIVLMFFIPYVLFQPPATVILRKLGPRNFLSLIVLLWGIVMIVSFVISNADQALIRY
jgi:MFS family permease